MNALERESSPVVGGVDAATAVECLYAHGLALHEAELYAEAAAVFRVMLQHAPTDERSWLALGDCHVRAGQHQVALELFSAGVAAAAPAPRCAIARFRELWDLDRIGEADEAFDEAEQIVGDTGDERLLSQLSRERELRP